MKKVLSFFMCIVMVLTIAPLSGILPLVSAVTKTGKINNIQWTLDTETGVLELSGTGGTGHYGSGDAESIIHGKDESPFYQNYRSQITTVKIGTGITSLGDYLFYKCSKISSITIPDTVKSIGESAFEGCNSMDVYITDISTLFISRSSNNFPTIKNLYLNGEEMWEVNIPEGTETFPAFIKNIPNITRVTIPSSITVITAYAFKDCTGLKSVVIPDSITEIGTSAFDGCTSLSDITIPNSATKILASAFRNCSSLSSITIPDSVITLGTSAFYSCDSLKTAVIGSGIKTIPSNAFYNCAELESIVIPESVTTVQSKAFDLCDSLTDVYYYGSKSSWNEINIYTGSSSTPYYNLPLLNATIHYNYTAHQHNYIASTTKNPTCKETGVLTYSCDCGDSYTEVIPTILHSNQLIGTVPGACLKDGHNVYKCQICGEYNVEIVHAIGHSYDVNGVCTVCGEISEISVNEETSVKLDREKNLISGLEFALDKDGFMNCITVTDDAIIEIDNDIIGTGAKVKIIDKATSIVLEEYAIVIFGDYNGDGVADIEDTGYFASIANFEIFDYFEYDYLFMAADVNGDGVVDVMDEEEMYAVANYDAYIDHTITEGSKVVRYS